LHIFACDDLLDEVLWLVVEQLSCSAAARLHTIVQDRPVEKLQESCFIVGSIERILTMSVAGTDSAVFMCLINCDI